MGARHRAWRGDRVNTKKPLTAAQYDAETCKIESQLRECGMTTNQTPAATPAHHCFECRAGEHDNYSEIAGKFVVTGNGDRPRTGYLCADHVDTLMTDGYSLKEVR